MSAVRVAYRTIEFGDTDIHVLTLRDRQQYADINGVAADLQISSAQWPLFGVIWESGEILAHLMFEFELNGQRILEVGCGIALASLVLNHRSANITATDYHPEAENFLIENVKLNHCQTIPFVRTGWADKFSTLGEFDLLIGSDLLYEQGHVELLSAFINQHAKPHCEVILVDPGRGYHARFSKKMVSLGYSHAQSRPDHQDYLTKPFKGQILRYQR